MPKNHSCPAGQQRFLAGALAVTLKNHRAKINRRQNLKKAYPKFAKMDVSRHYFERFTKQLLYDLN